MFYIIIAMDMLTSDFYMILSFGFETHTACQIFVDTVIVLPEPDTMYGCFRLGN